MRVILLLTTCCLCISQCDSTCFAGDFAACGTDTAVGTSCCLDGNLAAPTQYSIGYTEARCKQGRFQAMRDSDLKGYLTKHTVPVVIGPNGYYITDHHHLIAGLLNAKLKSTHHVVARVNYNWSGLSRTDFLKKMVQSNLMWLYDEKGYAPMNPLTVPPVVLDLPNDPYRSLASQAEYAGGFLNDGTPFCQFQWANLFRDANLLGVAGNTTKPGAVTYSWCQANPYDALCFQEAPALSSALPAALKMCKSDAAQHMCGYGKGVAKPQDCGKNDTETTIMPID